jgi:predicted ArsR family transcriptional regulator
MARLLALFEEAGFAPEAPTRPGGPIGLRACPFGLLPRDGSRAVCRVHRGLIEGVLDGLGAPADGVVLEPFVRPDLCLAHVGALGRG